MGGYADAVFPQQTHCTSACRSGSGGWYRGSNMASPRACALGTIARPPLVLLPQSTTVRRLDDLTYELHRQQKLVTGGTTALIHVLSADTIYTANVGDCKGVLSVRGAPDALNTCHNPPVPEERERFEAAGVHVSAGLV